MSIHMLLVLSQDIGQDMDMTYTTPEQYRDLKTLGLIGWNSRCKSGFIYRDQSGKYHPHACNNLTSRGELLCAQCASAEPIAEYQAIPTWQARYQPLLTAIGIALAVLVAVIW